MTINLTVRGRGCVTHLAVGRVTQEAGQRVQLWTTSGELIVSYEPTDVAYIDITNE